MQNETKSGQAATGLILTPVVYEFNFDAPFLSLASAIGLLVGAIFWSLGCDIWGRRSISHQSSGLISLSGPLFCRWSFNVPIFITGVFGVAAGGSPNFVTLASLLAVLGAGAGGKFTPTSKISCTELYWR